MSKGKTQPEKQLKDACQIIGARWALWVERSDNGWNFGAQHGLSQARLKSLRSTLKTEKITRWLAGALSSGRSRWHALAEDAGGLKVRRMYVIPSPARQQLLLVGAEQLDRTAEGLLRMLAEHWPPIDPTETGKAFEASNEAVERRFESRLEASYDPQFALENILEYLTRRIPCEAGYLAIRAGDNFNVQAVWNCPATFQGVELAVNENPGLQKILATRKGLVWVKNSDEALLRLPKELEEVAQSWLGVPVVVGRRVIGLVAFVSANQERYSSKHLEEASQLAKQLAVNIESAIIFREATHYLQQLALLNELASMAGLGSEFDSEHPADEFARRVMVRLRRVFNTDWAAVLRLSPDGGTLQESGGGSQSGPPWVVPVKDSLMGQAVENGQPVRVGDLRQVKRYYPLRQNLRSELAVPLKYRGKVTGALVLVSEEVNSFSIQDEQLLVVIASQLAGLFENVRLNEETRERARKLADSLRQLQAVRDTDLDLAGDLDLKTLLRRVAQRARDLVGARGAELGLYDEGEQVVEVVVAETPWENLQGMKIPLMAGVAGQIAAFGEPMVVADYNSWPGRLLPERKAHFHAVAGVPLIFKGSVIGTLIVLDDRAEKSFGSEDVALLELLAPQAAISIRNARLYQELEMRMQAQQLAEARLIRSARLAAVGEMAAGVAHELNNPLTTVSGFVELTLDELEKDSPLRADLELVHQEAERARGVVRRLLDFARPADDLASEPRKQGDLNMLIEQVLPLFHHLARISGIALQTELCADLPWTVFDPDQIKQVLINLIHNAIQAMPNGGTLTISSKHECRSFPDSSSKESTSASQENGNPGETGWLCLSVMDSGSGMPPDVLERIFEPFFTTRPAGKGTGLGLSVSYGIITSHGGWMEVDSSPGKGSNFRVYLPIK
jgi:two-component system NtrC family sensor kinase